MYVLYLFDYLVKSSFFQIHYSTSEQMLEKNQSLHKIKEIERSIAIMCDQIKIIGKQESHNSQQLQKYLEKCVPLIKSKIHQSEHHLKIKDQEKQNLFDKQNRLVYIKTRKNDNKQKMGSIKVLIQAVKRNDAHQIRLQRIKYQKKVKQQKNRSLQTNYIKSLYIKAQQNQIKQKIRSFHQQKIDDLGKLRQLQTSQKQKRVTKSSNLLRKITIQKNSFQMRSGQTKNNLTKLKDVMRKLKNMKPNQFINILKTTNKSINNSNQPIQTSNQSSRVSNEQGKTSYIKIQSEGQQSKVNITNKVNNFLRPYDVVKSLKKSVIKENTKIQKITEQQLTQNIIQRMFKQVAETNNSQSKKISFNDSFIAKSL